MTVIKSSLSIVASIIIGVAAALFLNSFTPKALEPAYNILDLESTQKPIILGFMPYWLLGKVSDESLGKLDTITYFGLAISSDGSYVRESNPGEAEPGFRTLQMGKFKERITGFDQNTSLLMHLANEASISALLSEPELHAQNLVEDIEPMMKEQGFNDLNIDIESFSEASQEAQADMANFLSVVKKELTNRDLGTLTTELTVASLVKQHLLVPEEVGKISDYVVLMAYDFHYSGSYVAGPVAPLGGAKEKYEYDVTQAVKLATQAIPSKKIILGIPLYGYEWETLSYEPGSPVIPGTGKTATTSRVKELLETCEKDCIKGRDEVSGTPFIILPPNDTSAIQQIFYEDKESVQKKLDIAKEFDLGGVGFWALGYENSELLQSLNRYEGL